MFCTILSKAKREHACCTARVVDLAHHSQGLITRWGHLQGNWDRKRGLGEQYTAQTTKSFYTLSIFAPHSQASDSVTAVTKWACWRRGGSPGQTSPSSFSVAGGGSGVLFVVGVAVFIVVCLLLLFCCFCCFGGRGVVGFVFVFVFRGPSVFFHGGSGTFLQEKEAKS